MYFSWNYLIAFNNMRQMWAHHWE